MIDKNGSRYDNKNIKVLCGKHQISVDPEPHQQGGTVDKVIVHEKYISEGMLSNDIAVMHLGPLKLSLGMYVSPVCLPDSDVAAGTMCTVTGWGLTSERPVEASDNLRQVTVPIIGNATCYQEVPLYGPDKLCAGYPEGGKGPFHGDSGGPLVCKQTDGRWVIHGIVSYSEGCVQPHKPGAYTRVRYYLKWIEAKTGINMKPSEQRSTVGTLVLLLLPLTVLIDRL